MTELREKIAAILRDERETAAGVALGYAGPFPADLATADRILAIPEIAQALSLPDNQS